MLHSLEGPLQGLYSWPIHHHKDQILAAAMHWVSPHPLGGSGVSPNCAVSKRGESGWRQGVSVLFLQHRVSAHCAGKPSIDQNPLPVISRTSKQWLKKGWCLWDILFPWRSALISCSTTRTRGKGISQPKAIVPYKRQCWRWSMMGTNWRSLIPAHPILTLKSHVLIIKAFTWRAWWKAQGSVGSRQDFALLFCSSGAFISRFLCYHNRKNTPFIMNCLPLLWAKLRGFFVFVFFKCGSIEN